MNRAQTRAQAIRDYRHYRRLITSKRITKQHRQRVAEQADALAARYNLTVVRYA